MKKVEVNDVTKMNSSLRVDDLEEYKTWEDVTKAYDENVITSSEFLYLLELFNLL